MTEIPLLLYKIWTLNYGRWVFEMLACHQKRAEFKYLMLCQALEAVEDANSDSSTSSTSSESLGVMPEGMDTIRPRKVRVQAPNPTFDIDT